MLTLPSAALVHLRQETRRLTVAGVIYKNDGTTVRCSQHDEDLLIVGGDYEGIYYSTVGVTASEIKAGSDLSTDNMEISGNLDDGIAFTGFNVADIEAGLFNKAPFETFLCQWDDPSSWQKTLRRGYLGEIARTDEGSFTCEWRGILQDLQQNIGRTYSETCDVKRFGDSRCGFNVNSVTYAATIAAVTSRRRFDLTVTGLPGGLASGYFDLGEVEGTSGPNAGYLKQIKRGAVSGTLGQVELWESLPADPQIGDTVTIRAGCDRRFESCQFFANTDNFRGHGRWIPGIPKIIRAP